MSTDIVAASPTDVATQMQWAQAVVARPNDRGAASILPEAYRDNPANVLVAVGLGASMGLSFAESLYRINVIKGKPSAAAELIASNVRKAGHKLRVRVSEEPPTATCTIIRADDPDEPTVITRDMAWAQRMGLTGEPNYKKQPATMLSYRAITACARLACPEALYGVAYTPDEIEDGGTYTAAPAAPAQSAAAPVTAADFRDDVVEGTVEPDEPQKASDSQSPPDLQKHDTDRSAEAETGELMSRDQVAEMDRLFTEAGMPGGRAAANRKARADYVSKVLDVEISPGAPITAWQASQVIEALIADLEAAEQARGGE